MSWVLAVDHIYLEFASGRCRHKNPQEIRGKKKKNPKQEAKRFLCITYSILGVVVNSRVILSSVSLLIDYIDCIVFKSPNKSPNLWLYTLVIP